MRSVLEIAYVASAPKTRRDEKSWTAALLAGISLAVVSGVSGLMIWAFSGTGTISLLLIAAFFPLMLLAAHCMDEIGRARKQTRLAEFEKTRR